MKNLKPKSRSLHIAQQQQKNKNSSQITNKKVKKLQKHKSKNGHSLCIHFLNCRPERGPSDDNVDDGSNKCDIVTNVSDIICLSVPRVLCVRQSPQCPPESNLEFCKMILCQNIGCRAVHWIQFTVTALPCCASTSTAVNCSSKYPMPYCLLESCTTAQAPPNWSTLLIEIYIDTILHFCTFDPT